MFRPGVADGARGAGTARAEADRTAEAQEKCPKFFKKIGHLEMIELRCFSQKTKILHKCFLQKTHFENSRDGKTLRLNLIQSG